MEGNLRLKIDWASLIVGRKFTFFALFYFVFEGNCHVQAPGDLYLEGRFNEGFFALRVWGVTFGGAFTRRGLFSEFYGNFTFVYLQSGVLHLLNHAVNILKSNLFCCRCIF